MERFYDWLESEYHGIDGLAAAFFTVIIIITIFLLLGFLFDYPTAWQHIALPGPYSAMIIAKNAFGEEALFRLLPFMIFFKFFSNRSSMLLLLITAQSVFYSYLHFGLVSLLVLFIIMVILSVTYLKFGGYRKHHLKAFIWTGSIHTAINISLHVIAVVYVSYL